MAMIPLAGRWRVRVVRKDSAWPQRVVISGALPGVIPGEVGRSTEVRGERWSLTIEYLPDSRWRESAFINARSVSGQGGQPARIVASKDHYWYGDADPNDLVLMLEQMVETPAFEVVGSVQPADGALRTLSPAGLGDPRARYLAVVIANASSMPFGYDAVLDISDTGRAALAERGVQVPAWSAQALRATRQEAFERAVSIPPLPPGQQAAVYFPIDSSAALGGGTDVEFEMRNLSGPAARERRTVPAVQIARNPGPAPTPVSSQASVWSPATGPGLLAQAAMPQAGFRSVPLGRAVRQRPARPDNSS